jgi:hypothetical protein
MQEPLSVAAVAAIGILRGSEHARTRRPHMDSPIENLLGGLTPAGEVPDAASVDHSRDALMAAAR